MKEETGYFSSFDDTKIFFRAWVKEVPHALIMVHGYGEHSGRYAELVEDLKDLPLSFFIADLRGHGKSSGDRVFVDRFDEFIVDLYVFRSFIETKLSGQAKKFILFGHSLGGLITTHAVLKHQEQWESLILSSPYFGLPVCNWCMRQLTKVLKVFGSKVIWSNPVDPFFMSHDPERVKRYKTDPHIQRKITINLAGEMMKAAKLALRKAGKIQKPVFILAAGDDRIVSLSNTREFYHRLRSADKKIEILNGFYHELFQERNREKPVGILKGYLNSQI
ncbi:MAG: hypothetical protein A3G33_10675 [Omnitrophica bacterium RIFCSPLOWO2_12_FULL_44_17]|uniref:Serine aminopeptidase S33 domain-containing protein n=1 Tax=Candidatus Danuiimicrobium aquiferis TaxID=1801832 RepID=A0A1G1KR94_9BACT|nr:MAG: hypothetical protein A3E74_06915 [Omnitrophica bacterium RIFCSPHIGHO2_12_FULL_44_12]OGW95433.1 MAG: hypothetical protein A3G33_10675 [Omnitrophica bacterium RIFCSPLOWO2_12_FULL_44_17]